MYRLLCSLSKRLRVFFFYAHSCLFCALGSILCKGQVSFESPKGMLFSWKLRKFFFMLSIGFSFNWSEPDFGWVWKKKIIYCVNQVLSEYKKILEFFPSKFLLSIDLSYGWVLKNFFYCEPSCCISHYCNKIWINNIKSTVNLYDHKQLTVESPWSGHGIKRKPL